MSFWNVTGADESNGSERTIRIYAADEREAEARGREQGLLISSIKAAGKSIDLPPPKPSRPIPAIEVKPKKPDDGLPEYKGLEAVRVMFYWSAWATVGLMGFVVLAIVIALIRSFVENPLPFIASSFGIFFSLFISAIFQFASAAAIAALRDIVRNSWRIANNTARPS